MKRYEKILGRGLFQDEAGTEGFGGFAGPGTVDLDLFGAADLALVEKAVDGFTTHFQILGIPQLPDFEMESVPGGPAPLPVAGTPRLRDGERALPLHMYPFSDAVFSVPIRAGIDTAFQSWHVYLLLFWFFAGKRTSIFNSLLKSNGWRG